MRSFPVLILTLFCLTATAFAEAPAAPQPPTITVGVSDVEPMVTFAKDGSVSGGYDVDVMNEIARRSGFAVTFKRYEFGQLIDAVANGEVDASMSGITITADREERIDFSQPYLDSGLQILTTSDHVREVTILDVLTQQETLSALGQSILVILCGMLILGVGLWVFDRGKDSIDDRFFPGVFQGMWLAIVTSSTVGYGDIVPKGWFGKVGAAFVIIAGTILFSVNTATIASRMTAQTLQTDFSSLRDLRGKRVATMRKTTSAERLSPMKVRLTLTDDVQQAVALVRSGKVDAVVYDAPVLQYMAKEDASGSIAVAGDMFDRQPYGIVLAQGSPLRERVDSAILRMREDGTFDRIGKKWFSDEME